MHIYTSLQSLNMNYTINNKSHKIEGMSKLVHVRDAIQNIVSMQILISRHVAHVIFELERIY